MCMAKEIAGAVARIDHILEARVGAEGVARVRATLAVLAELDDPHFENA